MMDLRLGNLRRDRSSVLVDVYVGDETAAIGCIDLTGFGILTLDTGGRPLTEGLLTGLFDRARRFAKRNEAEIARLRA
jgi:hypothetical protein